MTKISHFLEIFLLWSKTLTKQWINVFMFVSQSDWTPKRETICTCCWPPREVKRKITWYCRLRWSCLKMARRKQEAQLQQELETQEEWEDMLSKEGLFGKFSWEFLHWLVYNESFISANFIQFIISVNSMLKMFIHTVRYLLVLLLLIFLMTLMFFFSRGKIEIHWLYYW